MSAEYARRRTAAKRGGEVEQVNLEDQELSVEETAEVLQSSPRTVKREWRKARAWLYQELQGQRPAP